MSGKGKASEKKRTAQVAPKVDWSNLPGDWYKKKIAIWKSNALWVTRFLTKYLGKFGEETPDFLEEFEDKWYDHYPRLRDREYGALKAGGELVCAFAQQCAELFLSRLAAVTTALPGNLQVEPQQKIAYLRKELSFDALSEKDVVGKYTATCRVLNEAWETLMHVRTQQENLRRQRRRNKRKKSLRENYPTPQGTFVTQGHVPVNGSNGGHWRK